MGRQARHHFIPKTYLKGFTVGGENDSVFWGIPKSGDPFSTNPNDACVRRDYYSVDHNDSLIVEKFYATEIEPKISLALRYVTEQAALPSSDQMSNLILLLATLYLRTPSFRALIEAPMMRAREIVASINEDSEISNCAEFEYSQTDLIIAELRLIDKVQSCLANKYFRIYSVEGEFDVITSDRPFILRHPNGRKGFYYGLNTPDITICVPITRRTILVAQNEPFKEGTYRADEELIGLTNTKLFLSADKFVYSSKREILLVDDDFSVYRHTLGKEKEQR